MKRAVALRLLAIGLLMSCGAAHAAAPIYFDLGGLVRAVVMLFSAIVFLLAYLIGHWKGVAVACVLHVVGAVGFVHATRKLRRRWEHVLLQERFAEHRACYTRAGVTRHHPVPLGAPIHVIDLRPPVSGGHHWWIDPERLPDGAVLTPPEQPRDDPDAVYVEIGQIVEAVPDGDDRKLLALQAHVKDGRGRLLAELLDYRLSHSSHWSLGSRPPDSLMQFFEELFGSGLGLALPFQRDEPRVPVMSPRAVLTELRAGGLSMTGLTPPGLQKREDPAGKRQPVCAPPASDCRPSGRFEGRWVCLPDTPDENHLDASAMVACLTPDGRWLALDDDRGDFPPVVRVKERDVLGRLQKVWNVRLPPWHEPESPQLSRVLALRLEGTRLSLFLGIDEAYALRNAASGEAFFHRHVEYAADLLPEH